MTCVDGRLLAGAFAAAVFFPASAGAAECGPQQVLASVELLMQQNGVPLVPVSVVGKPKHFIVATGGYLSHVFPATVRELNLPRRTVSQSVVSANGMTSNAAARVSEFVIGGLRAQNVTLMVPPSQDTGDIPEGAPAGTLGPDVLQNYDVDLDFGAQKFGLIDPNHCEGKVVYWPAQTVAIIPFRLNTSSHIEFPATVDGKRVTAVLDTSASFSSMSLPIAQGQFDIDVNAPDVQKVGEIPGKGYTATVYARQFQSIALEGITIANPQLVLMPDMMRAQLRREAPTGGLIANSRQASGLPDLRLGMSTLSKLHVYIAYKERKLYITSADDAPP
jgi:predicted aspartyl protease